MRLTSRSGLSNKTRSGTNVQRSCEEEKPIELMKLQWNTCQLWICMLLRWWASINLMEPLT